MSLNTAGISMGGSSFGVSTQSLSMKRPQVPSMTERSSLCGRVTPTDGPIGYDPHREIIELVENLRQNDRIGELPFPVKKDEIPQHGLEHSAKTFKDEFFERTDDMSDRPLIDRLTRNGRLHAMPIDGSSKRENVPVGTRATSQHNDGDLQPKCGWIHLIEHLIHIHPEVPNPNENKPDIA